MGTGPRRIRNTERITKAPAPQRRFSQNFLTDSTTARKIVDAVPIGEHSTIIEIGPGTGALTKWLMQTKAKNIVAFDIDARSLEHIKQQTWYDPTRLTLIEDDILKQHAEEIRMRSGSDDIHVIGNIPYGITSDILFWLFDQRTTIASAVITMQREVAKRCVAQPGTKDYGILSVASWYASTAKLLFHIQPGSFFPRPDVTSSVVRFTLRESAVSNLEFAPFMEFVRAAFVQRRKVMSNTLKDWASRHNASLKLSEEHAGFDLRHVRSEALTPHQLAAVFSSLIQIE